MAETFWIRANLLLRSSILGVSTAHSIKCLGIPTWYCWTAPDIRAKSAPVVLGGGRSGQVGEFFIFLMDDFSTKNASNSQPHPSSHHHGPKNKKSENKNPKQHKPNKEIKSLFHTDIRGSKFDAIWDTPIKFPRYVIITPTEEHKSFKEFSPFKITDEIKKVCQHLTPSVQKEGRSIVVETEKPEDSESLQKVKSFLEFPVEVTPHRRLNSSRGVIKSWEFKNATPEEWLGVPGILEARQIVSRRGGAQVTTPLWFLTFDEPIPPSSVKAGYIELPVRPYIRKPLRCYQCQLFGHPGKYCRNRSMHPMRQSRKAYNLWRWGLVSELQSVWTHCGF